MRSRALSRFLDLQHRLPRSVASRATGTVGHGEELGPELRQLRARRGQLFHALRRRWRKELEAEDAIGAAGHWCTSFALMRQSFLAGKQQSRQRPGNDAVQDCATARGQEACPVKPCTEGPDNK